MPPSAFADYRDQPREGVDKEIPPVGTPTLLTYTGVALSRAALYSTVTGGGHARRCCRGSNPRGRQSALRGGEKQEKESGQALTTPQRAGHPSPIRTIHIQPPRHQP